MENVNLLDQFFMNEALKQARLAYDLDEVPVGAIVVYKNKLIAKAHNQVETLKDPTAHAEMIAITQATNYLQSKWLNDCVLYVTLEPCSMCAGALVLSRIKKIIFAAADPKSGACGTIVNIAHHQKLNHRIDVANGLLKDESQQLLSNFFKQKRKKT